MLCQVLTRFLLLVAMAGFVRPPFAEAQETFLQVINEVNVVNVLTGEVRPDQRVILRGTKVEQIGPAKETPIPDGAIQIEAGGRYLIPGLFDAHVHLASDAEQYASLLVAHGVTSVRDLGAPTDMILSLKRSAATNEEPTPDITATGAIIDGKPPVWPFSEACETEEQATAAVRKLALAGVDQIKVYSLLKKEVYLAAVAEAKRIGLPVTGHIPYSITIEEATKAGQRGIEHLDGFAPLFNCMTGNTTKMDDAAKPSMQESFKGWSQWSEVDRKVLSQIIREQKSQGVVHVPTLTVMSGIGRISDPQDDPKQDPRMKFVSSAMEGFWTTGKYDTFSQHARAALPAMTELVVELHRQGITLAIGTDLANPYVFAGSAVHDEMERFSDAGISAAEILKMATINSARLCGVDQERGTIEVGKTASLVLLDENPLQDIRAIRKIRAVWLRGKHLDRSALDQLLQSAEQRVDPKGTVSDLTHPPEMPGEVIRKGVYELKFSGFDAGSQSFVVTKAADGFHVWSHSNPQGGGQIPAITRAHFSHEGELVSASYQTLSGKQLMASYRIVDGHLVGEAKSADKLTEAKHPLSEPFQISLPVYAADFMYYRGLGLKVGDTTRIQSVGFGFPDWKPAAIEVEIKRTDDEILNVDNLSVACTVYHSSFETPMGNMKMQTWSDSEGHTVKTLMKFQFGSLSGTRKLDTAK